MEGIRSCLLAGLRAARGRSDVLVFPAVSEAGTVETSANAGLPDRSCPPGPVPLFRPGAASLGGLGAPAGPVHFGSPSSQRFGRKSSCRRAPPAGLFFSACLGADRNCQYRIDLYQTETNVWAVTRGAETSGNSPCFSRLPRGSGSWACDRDSANARSLVVPELVLFPTPRPPPHPRPARCDLSAPSFCLGWSHNAKRLFPSPALV